jgi:malate synthase
MDVVTKPYIRHGDIQVSQPLDEFIEKQVFSGTGVDADTFWQGFARILMTFAPENRALLAKRNAIQTQIDEWHVQNRSRANDPAAYRAFLGDIGYLVPEPAAFSISTVDVDDEIARMAGPQLVVPALNDRFVLNAANARWGSLYDALYGTDVVPAEPGEAAKGYDSKRGARVIAYAKEVGAWKIADWSRSLPPAPQRRFWTAAANLPDIAAIHTRPRRSCSSIMACT